MSRRYIVQRPDGTFLERELPLTTDGAQWALSAAGSLSGTVPAAFAHQVAEDGRPLLEERNTLIYEEEEGIIRWGGELLSVTLTEDGYELDCMGLASYPHGQAFGGKLRSTSLDPAAGIAAVWADLQGHPDGDLGVQVIGTTPVRLGSTEDPYELHWADTPDCGREIDQLTDEAPLDWTEEHEWDGEQIAHRILIHYPRAGRKRDDLSFVLGENIVATADPVLDGDGYANEVVGIGAGEGERALRSVAAARDGRLRRSVTVAFKDVTSQARLDTLTRAELQRRTPTLRIDDITVRDHDAAPIGSWQLGDDIFVETTHPRHGRIELWCRVTAWQRLGDDQARISLARSDLYNYGA